MTERMLEIRGLKVHFNTEDGVLRAVDGVDLGIDAGETLGVVGESGCGKSVTALTIMRLLPMPPGRIVAGEIRWQGQDLVKAGDEVLREFGRRLRENIRPMDLACRYGGEEFVVIMPETSQALAQSAGDRLRQIIAETPFPIGRGDELKVTMSGGVSTIAAPEDTIDALLKRADDALYRAKSAGRNLIEVESAGFA